MPTRIKQVEGFTSVPMGELMPLDPSPILMLCGSIILMSDHSETQLTDV